MADTTIEEAQRCPICEEPAKIVQTQRPQHLPRRTRVLVMECQNTRCATEGERFLVQINPDNTIPKPGGRRGPKSFELPGSSTVAAQMARDELKLIDFMTTHPNLTEQEARRALERM